jgi:D-glycero-D-manno-heptose 1,7-bisphosphate phosphatase
MNQFLILDRDQVLNHMPIGQKYITSPNGIRLIKKNVQGLKKLSSNNLKIIVATNQRCIGLGIISISELNSIHFELSTQLLKNGVKILEFFYCPHTILDACNCRKPQPGLLEAASKKYNFKLKDSIFIGDAESDCYAGIKAGSKVIHLTDRKTDEEIKSNNNYLGSFSDIDAAKETIDKFYLG